MRLRNARVGLIAAVLLVTTSCVSRPFHVTGVAGSALKAYESPMPPSVLGLTISPEDVTDPIKHFRPTYVDAVSVVGLRTPDSTLQATLQVSHFVPKSNPSDRNFQHTLLAGIGGSEPQAMRLGSLDVYKTTATDQQLYVWFRKRVFYILAARNDFPQQRRLLRDVVDMTATA
jgi:hypothetical protein